MATSYIGANLRYRAAELAVRQSQKRKGDGFILRPGHPHPWPADQGRGEKINLSPSSYSSGTGAGFGGGFSFALGVVSTSMSPRANWIPSR